MDEILSEIIRNSIENIRVFGGRTQRKNVKNNIKNTLRYK